MKLAHILTKLMNQDQKASKVLHPNHEAHPNGHVALHPEPSSMPNHLLSGQTALITGAGKNIGRGIALEMATQGANIIFTDIDKERTLRLEQELCALKVNARGFVSDVSSPRDTDSLLHTLSQEQLSIDLLINNAGIGSSPDRSPQTLRKKWQTTFATNVFGPMNLIEAIAPNMKTRGGGSILFITSIHQWITGGSPHYSASKAALGMMIKELAVDLAPFHIRVNGIAPGWVEEDEEGKTLCNHYSLLNGRSINPTYIGRAAVYLASNYFSKFTTGTVLKIDDGLSLSNQFIKDHPGHL